MAYTWYQFLGQKTAQTIEGALVESTLSLIPSGLCPDSSQSMCELLSSAKSLLEADADVESMPGFWGDHLTHSVTHGNILIRKHWYLCRQELYGEEKVMKGEEEKRDISHIAWKPMGTQGNLKTRGRPKGTRE